MLTMLWRPFVEERKEDHGAFAPWSRAGGPDPSVDDDARRLHHAFLTDPALMEQARWHVLTQAFDDYDTVIRLLDHVWDCPNDGSVNVTGFRCAACGELRASVPRRGRRFRRRAPSAI